MVEKAQAVFNSGKTVVDVMNAQKQLDSIQILGNLYEENIDISNRSITKLNDFDYDQLSKDITKLATFSQGKNHSGSDLEQMINLYAKTSKSVDEIKIITNTVRTAFDSMNTIAKKMSGPEPRNLDEMLNEPKKIHNTCALYFRSITK